MFSVTYIETGEKVITGDNADTVNWLLENMDIKALAIDCGNWIYGCLIDAPTDGLMEDWVSGIVERLMRGNPRTQARYRPTFWRAWTSPRRSPCATSSSHGRMSEMDSTEAYEAACHLYDGGWRAEDADWIRSEYGLSDYETLLIYYALVGIENGEVA